jgi:hypothetical protein
LKLFLTGGAFALILAALFLTVPPRLTEGEIARQVALARKEAWARRFVVGGFVVHAAQTQMIVGTNTLSKGDKVASLETGAHGTVVDVKQLADGGTKLLITVKWDDRGMWPTLLPKEGEAYIRLQGRAE